MNLALRDNKKLELKKHVNAIHCSNNLTLLQRKLFNALLFNAYPELPYKQKFQIRGRDLYKLIGYNSKDSCKLKNALLGLITIAIEWNVIDCSTGQEKKWKASSILASAELADGLCVYEYSQVMKDFLYQPEIYGRINIELVSRFKSNYGLALYENCIRYQGLAQTPWFPLIIFRKLMGVFDDKYSAFKDFKKRVVDIAVNEINTISPISIEPEVERVNQKVIRIRFKLSKKLESEINCELINKNTILDDELNGVLTEVFGLSKQSVAEVISIYDVNYIREKIEIITKSNSFVGGKIKGLAGYLLEALKKDYKASKSSKAIVDERRKILEVKEEESKQKEKSRVERYGNYVSKKITSYLSTLTDEQSKALLSDFKFHIQRQNNILYEWYKKNGLNHPATQGCFNNFVIEYKKEYLGDILSIEDFINLIDENN